MKRISRQDIESLVKKAKASPRLRQNHNLHPGLDDPVQRLYNAIEPGSYVRPHRHLDAGRWELFLVLSGAVAILTFDEQGAVTGRLDIQAGGPNFGAEIPSGTWHTVVSLKSGTVLFEFKPGPYVPVSDKDFASWAPEEGNPACCRWVSWFQRTRQGDQFPRAADDC